VNVLIRKIIPLVLVLFLLGNSEEPNCPSGLFGDPENLPNGWILLDPCTLLGPMLQFEPHGHFPVTVRKADISGDTLRLKSDEAYAVFSGSPIQEENFGAIITDIKVKSIIRGDIDTTNYPIIGIGFIEEYCPNVVIDTNQNYLVFSHIVYDVGRGEGSTLGLKCENILLDTPKNRHKLAKKYNKMVVIPYEPTQDSSCTGTYTVNKIGACDNFVISCDGDLYHTWTDSGFAGGCDSYSGRTLIASGAEIVSCSSGNCVCRGPGSNCGDGYYQLCPFTLTYTIGSPDDHNCSNTQ